MTCPRLAAMRRRTAVEMLDVIRPPGVGLAKCPSIPVTVSGTTITVPISNRLLPVAVG